LHKRIFSNLQKNERVIIKKSGNYYQSVACFTSRAQGLPTHFARPTSYANNSFMLEELLASLRFEELLAPMGEIYLFQYSLQINNKALN